MDYDGFISVNTGNGYSVDTYINGVLIVYTPSIAYGRAMLGGQFPVKKGDSVYIVTTATIFNNHARFFKLRDYSNR